MVLLGEMFSGEGGDGFADGRARKRLRRTILPLSSGRMASTMFLWRSSVANGTI